MGGLARICSPNIGLTFAAKMLIGGKFEGRVVVFEADKYPFGCIGPCRFIWKPDTSPENRKIWIWSHPSIYEQIIKELVTVWDMKPANDQSAKEDESPKVFIFEYKLGIMFRTTLFQGQKNENGFGLNGFQFD